VLQSEERLKVMEKPTRSFNDIFLSEKRGSRGKAKFVTEMIIYSSQGICTKPNEDEKGEIILK